LGGGGGKKVTAWGEDGKYGEKVGGGWVIPGCS